LRWSEELLHAPSHLLRRGARSAQGGARRRERRGASMKAMMRGKGGRVSPGHGFGRMGMYVGATGGRHTYEHGRTLGASLCFPKEGANSNWAALNEINDTNYEGVHIQGISPVVRRKRRVRVQRQITQLSEGSESEISEYEV
jgi:hypothetical protein